MSKGEINTYKHPGQPTKYDEKKVCAATRKYIDDCVDGYEKVLLDEKKNRRSGKVTKFYGRKFRVKIPTVEGLAVVLKVHKDTIQEWKKTHPEFSVLMGELLGKQADRLMHGGLSGEYNPTITKVLLTKHGYREGMEHANPDGSNLFRPSNDDKAAADKALKDMS